MNQYSAYGLTIESEFELLELPPSGQKNTTSDVVIQSEDVEPVPRSVDDTGGRRFQVGPDTYRISYESVGSFLVESGEKVFFDPVSADVVETKAFRRLVENEILGLLLHQRGLLVLLASAVSVDGEAAVFLGERGAGKSTTAAAFHVAGHSVLEDDIVGIRIEDGRPVVVPGVPQLRLAPDTATALSVETVAQPSGDWGPEKRYGRIDEVADPTPLTRCYVLQPAGSLSVEELSGHDVMLELIARTHARGLLSETGTEPEHLEQCSEIAETIPSRVLYRPEDYDELPSLVDLVVKDLQRNLSSRQ